MRMGNQPLVLRRRQSFLGPRPLFFPTPHWSLWLAVYTAGRIFLRTKLNRMPQRQTPNSGNALPRSISGWFRCNTRFASPAPRRSCFSPLGQPGVFPVLPPMGNTAPSVSASVCAWLPPAVTQQNQEKPAHMPERIHHILIESSFPLRLLSVFLIVL